MFCFAKSKMGLGPLATSALGGGVAAALTMLGAERRLMQTSLLTFLYYCLQVSTIPF